MSVIFSTLSLSFLLLTHSVSLSILVASNQSVSIWWAFNLCFRHEWQMFAEKFTIFLPESPLNLSFRKMLGKICALRRIRSSWQSVNYLWGGITKIVGNDKFSLSMCFPCEIVLLNQHHCGLNSAKPNVCAIIENTSWSVNSGCRWYSDDIN